MTLYRFECHDCGFDDIEAGELATEEQVYCPLCAEDSGRAVRLFRWPEGTPFPGYARKLEAG